MNIDLSGKVALITGAGSGMGLASAEAFLEAGASATGYSSMKFKDVEKG